MKTPRAIAAEVMDANNFRDYQEATGEEVRKWLEDAITADRAQRPIITTLANDDRDIEVGIWPAHPSMSEDGGPHAIVVQIDTGSATGRIRINLNDAAVWDGDPDLDSHPGAYFKEES